MWFKRSEIKILKLGMNIQKITCFVFTLLILNSCLSLRPISGTISDKQSGKPVIGAKVYNKSKTYETALSDLIGHFYFLSPRSLFAIRLLKIMVEKEFYKSTEVKYRKFESEEIRLDYKYLIAYNDSDCEPTIDTIEGQKVYKIVNKMPVYRTGEAELIKYIIENFKYPEPLDNDPQYKVKASFVIDTFGKIRNECISKSYIKGTITPMELEFLKMLGKMPDWHPGEQNGKKVPVRIFLPVGFKPF